MGPNFQGLPWFEFDGLVEDELLLHFSIDNAHLIYNAHPKLFDIPFYVSMMCMTYFSIDN
jgi:hypothetical protein